MVKRPAKHKDNQLWAATRVYLPQGRVAHLLQPDASPNSHYPSLCGIAPAYYTPGWFGTGSQDEHEKAAAMASCINCQRIRRNP